MTTFKEVSVLEGIKALESLGRVTRTKSGLAKGVLMLSHRWNAKGLGLKGRKHWKFRQNSSGHILIGNNTRVMSAEIRKFGSGDTDYIVVFSVYDKV